MQASTLCARVCKTSTSASTLRSSSRNIANLARCMTSSQQRTASQALKTVSATTSRLQQHRQQQWRSLRTSSRCLAEEVKGGMPFESNVMNLLANNEEFRKLVNEFAERMKELLNIDVNEGQMPSMSDMMRCAQDPQLRELSVKLTAILQKDGVNLSPDTLKMLWSNMQGKGQS